MSRLEVSGYPGLCGPEGAGRLTLEPGERAVLRGESGAGKSRLLKRILRLDPEDRGSIRFEGGPLETYSATELRGRILLVPQDPPRPPRTAWQLWERIRAFRGNQGRAASDAELRSVFEQLDVAVESEKPLSELSGGEGRRLWLGMGLGLERALLLLDEPTSGLDARRSLALWELVGKKLRDGGSALWVSHDALPDPGSADRCYEVVRTEEQG